MSGAAAFGWEPAWKELPDDHPCAGTDYYPIPREDGGSHRICPGDRFWHSDERCIHTVEAVKRKIYRGVVGPAGDRGGVSVFFTHDTPNKDHMNRPTDNRGFISVERFGEQLYDGTLVPHAANGIRLPP